MPGNKVERKLTYTQEKLDEALASIQNGMSYREASELYGIPKSTLSDRITGKRDATVGRHGRAPVLTQEEENHLKSWLIEMARRGFGQTPSQCKLMVKRILDLSARREPLFKDNMPGRAWWNGFQNRHPDLKKVHTEKLEISRAIACRPDKIRAWFNEYKQHVEKLGIKTAAQVYNCDESGFPLQNKGSGKVIVSKESKTAYHITGNSKIQITSLICICANGNSMPPFVIFPGKTINPTYAVDLPPGSVSFATDSGWMTTLAFEHWMKNIFVPNLPAIRPVLLLMDGHSSHIDYQVGKYCRENGVELLCLPAHTSHVTQPLDKGVFRPFKQEWRKACNQFCQNHPGSTVDKFTFGRLFSTSYMKACAKEIIINSFKATGMWPVNVEAVDFSKMDAALSFPVMVEDEEENIETASSVLAAPVETPCAVPTFPVETPFSETIPNFDDKSSTVCSVSSVATKSATTQLPNAHVPVAERMVHPTDGTLPGCSKDVQFIVATSTPVQKPDKGSRTEEALRSLEKTLSTEHLVLFRKRLEEGYDVFTDPVFVAWKSLKVAYQKEERERMAKITATCIRNKDSSAARKELLMVPVAEKRKLPVKKNKLSSSHINSDVSLQELESKLEVKTRKEEEKRLRKEITAKRKADKLQEKAQREKKKKDKANGIKVRKVFKKKVSNECEECGAKWVGDDNEPRWIQCDDCLAWFHVKCTHIDDKEIDDEELEEMTFYCELCEAE